MNHSTLPARFRAIRELQVRRDQYPFGSKRFDELDHAIDLALNERRRVDAFLTRNAVRDAERIVRRRRSRNRMILHADLPPADDGSDTVLEDALPDVCSPEEALRAEQMLERVEDASERHVGRGTAALSSLLQGHTTRETAAVLGISPAHAFAVTERIRRTVRELAEV